MHSRGAWALLLLLDRLPWPWGEEIVARLFVARAFVRISRRRQALAWASAQPGRDRRRLARALHAHMGRWVSRMALLGFRHPDDLRPHVIIKGGEHLSAVSSGAILLGFHLGAPLADVALRLAGHRLTRLGSLRPSPIWSTEAWRPFRNSEQIPPFSRSGGLPGAALTLNQARRILLAGGVVYTLGDGGGREAFRVALPGGPAVIRSGWLALHRQTRAAVLPVLSHFEGRTQVVVIHPPLPVAALDPAGDLAACRDVIGGLLEDYVRRFPEQCYYLAFRPEEEVALLKNPPSPLAPRDRTITPEEGMGNPT